MTSTQTTPQQDIVIATGAASGIGLAIATAFLEASAKVAAVDINVSGLAALRQKFPDQIKVFEEDATDETAIRAIVADVLHAWNRIDILVNNVGGRIGSPDLDVPRDAWDATLDLCLNSHLCWSQTVLPIMKQQAYGRVVNIASNAGVYRSNTGSSGLSYSVAKSGVVQLTRSLAHEFGRYGITVNAIAPGSVLTEAGLVERDELEPALYDRVMRETALGYFAPPSEMASIVRFLGSPQASYVNGVTLKANGGWCTN